MLARSFHGHVVQIVLPRELLSTALSWHALPGAPSVHIPGTSLRFPLREFHMCPHSTWQCHSSCHWSLAPGLPFPTSVTTMLRLDQRIDLPIQAPGKYIHHRSPSFFTSNGENLGSKKPNGTTTPTFPCFPLLTTRNPAEPCTYSRQSTVPQEPPAKLRL